MYLYVLVHFKPSKKYVENNFGKCILFIGLLLSYYLKQNLFRCVPGISVYYLKFVHLRFGSKQVTHDVMLKPVVSSYYRYSTLR